MRCGVIFSDVFRSSSVGPLAAQHEWKHTGSLPCSSGSDGRSLPHLHLTVRQESSYGPVIISSGESQPLQVTERCWQNTVRPPPIPGTVLHDRVLDGKCSTNSDHHSSHRGLDHLSLLAMCRKHSVLNLICRQRVLLLFGSHIVCCCS